MSMSSIGITHCPQCNAPTVKNTVQGRNAPRHEFVCSHCRYTIVQSLSDEERAVFNVQGIAGLRASPEYRKYREEW